MSTVTIDSINANDLFDKYHLRHDKKVCLIKGKKAGEYFTPSPELLRKIEDEIENNKQSKK